MNLVFVNGVFDLVHSGHLKLLKFARQQGAYLVVGINSDNSVRKLKGPSRPINNEQERMEMLLALKCVGSVRIFNDDSPAKLLSELRPQIWVKGDEYTFDKLTPEEQNVVIEYDIKLVNYKKVEGLSTTNLIKKIRELSL